MKPTREERQSAHKKKMAEKKYDREHAPMTALQSAVAAEKKAGTFKQDAMNISKGEKRTRPPVYS